MGSIADIIISFLNVLEAEGKALRAGIARIGIILTLLALVGALFLTGMGLIVWAIYLYLRIDNSPATAALLDGLIALIIAGVLTWIVKRLAR